MSTGGYNWSQVH